MSVVTGITVQVGLGEEKMIEFIQSWFKEKGFDSLKEVTNGYGGSKHPQIQVFGGGYNYFPDEDFSRFLNSISEDRWECPERVIIIVQPEEGGARLYSGIFIDCVDKEILN